ncbi:heterokaryon incompatibility protein Het-C-domain-containing protein [Rhypophila decipiens]|uniref:Heterokaryon incompatibility protein Het-C-domain-containing protein n=1 Tax=Rhypophila decipiens TaxID=261697 RepID=A0AAN6YC27_9PEZI|nr:heterokaryon incompatibility protein Het-C-domain-containing protein [Rhypophila decipiens]
MAGLKPFPLILGLVVLFCFASPALAFGAGNIASISSVEGQNWRHGDIEDALLKILMARAVGGKKFNKIMVSRVYFGNWLRDYSQAIDVGTVKNVSAEAIRLLLCVLGFLTFGYGSREFEVTADRLGCYRPEDHIDNPKDYADNEDARNYDRRLRGPINEEVELGVDQETGMKNYIANEKMDIMTSAKHVRALFKKCIELARSYSRSNENSELYEALRLMGTGLHCLEDFLAHSNYVELALIELGERDIFPHVGRETKLNINGARGEVYPLVTGTFGGVDFLHSVTGEVADKLTQSELEDLEGTLKANANKDTSYLRELLDKIPDGVLGSDKKNKVDEIQQNAAASQMENVSVSPRDPEEFTQYISNVFANIRPAIEFHDDILQTISAAVEKIPVLNKVIEQLEEQLSLWVFTIIAPFIIPVLDQVKNELATGATEIIESSKNQQHIVFEDDRCTDPTHSMLSKDHFSNILNEIAGKTASKVVSWVVPQLMSAWDDDNADVDRVLNKIIYGILHHPAQRDQGPDGAAEGRKMMFENVKHWWECMDDRARDEYREKLSRDGVEQGRNHKEGVHDTGHGCGHKLGMKKVLGPETLEDRIAGQIAGAVVGGVAGGISDIVEQQTGYKLPTPPRRQEQQESSGSGGLGGFLESVAGNLLGGGFKSEEKGETQTYQTQSSGRTEEGGYQTTTQQYSRTERDDGRQEERYEQRTETTYGSGGGGGYGRREEQQEESSSYGGGRRRQEEEEQESSSYGRRRQDDEQESSSYGRRQESSGYGGEAQSYGRQESSGYGGEAQSYGRQESSGYGGEAQSYGRQESSGYGGESQSYGRSQGGGEAQSYGRGDREEEDNNNEYGGGRRHRRNDDNNNEEEEGSGYRRW